VRGIGICVRSHASTVLISKIGKTNRILKFSSYTIIRNAIRLGQIPQPSLTASEEQVIESAKPTIFKQVRILFLGIVKRNAKLRPRIKHLD